MTPAQRVQHYFQTQEGASRKDAVINALAHFNEQDDHEALALVSRTILATARNKAKSPSEGFTNIVKQIQQLSVQAIAQKDQQTASPNDTDHAAQDQ
jgi:hypothetical protein